MPSNTDRLTDNVTPWQKFPECQIFKGLRLAALLSASIVGRVPGRNWSTVRGPRGEWRSVWLRRGG